MGLRWKLVLPPALGGALLLVAASAHGLVDRPLLSTLAGGLAVVLAIVLLANELMVLRPLAHLGDPALPHGDDDSDEIRRWDREIRHLRTSLAQTQASLEQVREDWRDARTGLQRSEERFAAAVRGAHDGMWEWEPENEVVRFSPRWKAMLGYADDEFPDQYESWLDHLHPDDVERVQEEIGRHLDGALTHFEQQLRMRHKDGRYRWLLSRGAALRHANGRPYRVVGLDTDITRVKRVESIIQQIAEGTDGANGDVFFHALVQHFAAALAVNCAFITECVDHPPTRVRTLAFWKSAEFQNNIEFDLANTPCEAVVKQGLTCVHRSGVGRMFPRDAAYESYIGLPIFGSGGEVIGHLAFFDTREMSEDVLAESIMRIFTARAGAELERRQALARLTDRPPPRL
ncbi:MAG: PAS domain-containing protein [Zoogloeaceae bacterium]|nr:PAS domain-containing protein [Rhodocyclaceae bacterium]MCP5235953.1 PAS domain-containing protein [Zoogloeaceae bacterium]